MDQDATEPVLDAAVHHQLHATQPLADTTIAEIERPESKSDESMDGEKIPDDGKTSFSVLFCFSHASISKHGLTFDVKFLFVSRNHSKSSAIFFIHSVFVQMTREQKGSSTSQCQMSGS